MANPNLSEQKQASGRAISVRKDYIEKWRREKDETLQAYEEAGKKMEYFRGELEKTREVLLRNPDDVLVIDMYREIAEKYSLSVREYYTAEVKQLLLRKEMIKMGIDRSIIVKQLVWKTYIKTK